jgi:mono/diheme cytochrome c family protein
MKKLFILSILGLFGLATACGDDKKNTTKTETPAANTESQPAESASSSENPAYDPHRGEGKFKDVQVDEKLNVQMATAGQTAFEVKCSSCHKLTDEKLVGPGWAGVTQRRSNDWIMNFITNPDVMIDKDPEAQAMLEICLVRMPNQNLSDEEARNLLEFMRKNDGVKP